MGGSFLDWRQTDDGLNLEEGWTAERFPDATYHYFSECGCLVCALAVMLCHHGFETADEGTFDPWVLNARLIDCGAFSRAADLDLAAVSRLYPLAYLGAVPYARGVAERVVEDGCCCLLTVPGTNAPRHFTTLLRMAPDGVLVYDPLCGPRLLRTDDEFRELRVFRAASVAGRGQARATGAAHGRPVPTKGAEGSSPTGMLGAEPQRSGAFYQTRHK